LIMNVQHIRYFIAACQYKNISRAAEKINVSQSSISAAIKKLEKRYGVPLIKRQKIGFELTEEGEVFCALVEKLSEHIEQVENIMTDMTNKHHTIRLGIPPMAGSILLPTVLSRFSSAYPEINTSYVEDGGNALFRQIKENVLDIILVPENIAQITNDYNCVTIAKYEDVCCVSKEHPLAKNKTISVDELSKYPMVVFSEKFYHHDSIMDLFEEENKKPNICYRTTQLSIMEQLIVKNNVVGFLFRERADQVPEIVGIPFEPRRYTNIVLVWKKGKYISSDMKKLIRFFTEYNSI